MNKIRKLLCYFGKHRQLYVVRKLGYGTRLIGCKECKRYFGMNDNVRAILPFTDDMYEMYSKHLKVKGLRKYITRPTITGFL